MANGPTAPATKRSSLLPRRRRIEVELAEGSYAVAGRNPDGGRYKGTVEIEKDGDEYHVSWKVGIRLTKAPASSKAISSPSNGAAPRQWSMRSPMTAA